MRIITLTAATLRKLHGLPDTPPAY